MRRGSNEETVAEVVAAWHARDGTKPKIENRWRETQIVIGMSGL